VRTTFEFDFVTTATPDQVVELMTDFSPNQPHRWPASSPRRNLIHRRLHHDLNPCPAAVHSLVTTSRCTANLLGHQ
jgi:hypothetical protein